MIFNSTPISNDKLYIYAVHSYSVWNEALVWIDLRIATIFSQSIFLWLMFHTETSFSTPTNLCAETGTVFLLPPLPYPKCTITINESLLCIIYSQYIGDTALLLFQPRPTFKLDNSWYCCFLYLRMDGTLAHKQPLKHSACVCYELCTIL